MPVKKKSTRHIKEASFPVVLIGASAGGLNALKRFLSGLPQPFDFAAVFMQHMSAAHDSRLVELLGSQRQDISFVTVEDGLAMRPGCFHICPPGMKVTLKDDIFKVTVAPTKHPPATIDDFFCSSANSLEERLIAVILSGSGSDGAKGARCVQNKGGTVFVQDPDSAEFPDMPLAASASGQADALLSPEKIAAEIIMMRQSGVDRLKIDSLAAPADLEILTRILHEKTGCRFDQFKKKVLARRIRRRMYLHGFSSTDDYAKMLKHDEEAVSLLAADLMIGVTCFFRDKEAWKILRKEVIGKLAMKKATAPVRVWVPACATGEEAYSVGMMLHQEMERTGGKREINIFATDINDRALADAREGIYPDEAVTDIPTQYRQYFSGTEDGKSVTVSKAVRECIVFARQDILADPPFSRLELILCRNLLIYLEPNAQDRCISLFHFALRPGGFLFLGNAESITGKNDLFTKLSQKHCRIYRKVDDTASTRMPVPAPFPADRYPTPPTSPSAFDTRTTELEIIQASLLDRYAPAAVAIDHHFDIVYHNGPTNKYLLQPRGGPTVNLLRMLSENHRNRIRGAVYRVDNENQPVNIRLQADGEGLRRNPSTLHISKLRENLFLIVFQEAVKKRGAGKEKPEELCSPTVAAEESALRQLEAELSATRLELQNHIEQLKSLNEELQSSNEELQAANEELETSREELQSLNEELLTVNSQLQDKIEEQDETNNDLNNFLASTNIPTIFLDRKFRVKRFTPAMSRLVKLIPSDVGRPIMDMSRELLGSELIEDSREVLDRLLPVKREMRIAGTVYSRTALPYRTTGNRIEGVVVTYQDITELRTAEEASKRLASFPQLNPNPVIEVDSEGNISFRNEATGKILQDLGLSVEDISAFLPADLPELLQNLAKGHESSHYSEIRIKDKVFGENVHLTGRFNVARIYAQDITERKRAEEDLRESEQRVRHKLDSLLSPEGDLGELDLADIIDAEAIQALMDDFFALAALPMSIIDMQGKLLVGVGWQKICTEFHRVHPETCRNCIESDLLLSAGVPHGDFKLYKCKNNMWDVATPIIVGGRQVGNLFMGQFFFEEEEIDYDFFRSQAKRYGFNEKKYIGALKKVPRLSRQRLERSMAFFLKLADILSQSSYGTLKLARTLAEHDALLESLSQSEDRLKRAQEIAHLGSWELDLAKDLLTWSDEVYRIFGLSPQQFGATYEAFLDRVHPEDRDAVNEAYSVSIREGRDTYEIEHRVVRVDTGDIRTVHEKCEHFRDGTGRIVRSAGMVHDITDKKKAEKNLRRALERFSLLSETAARLLTAENPQKIVEDLCKKVMTHLDCQVFFNFLVDESQESLRLNAYAGIPEEEAKKLQVLEFGSEVCGLVARDKKRMICENLADSTEERTERLRSFDIAAYCCYPLRAGETALGTLAFGTSTRGSFTPEEIELMQTVAVQVSIAMERLRARQDLEKRVSERTADLERSNVQLEHEIAEKIRAESELRILNDNLEYHADQLRALAVELSRVEERERRRIATLLHDHLQQLLVGVRMRLESATRTPQLDSAHSKVNDAIGILDSAIKTSRSLTVELSPPVLHEAGLNAGLNWLAERMAETNQLQVDFSPDKSAEPEEDEVRFLLFECVRELLFNIVKHAGVDRAVVSLQRSDRNQLQLSVEDSGRGFDPDRQRRQNVGKTAFGLFSIEQRLRHLCGRVDIVSAPDQGTRVVITLPVSLKGESGAPEAADKPVKAVAQASTAVEIRPVSVMIVDDSEIMRDSLVSLLGSEPGFVIAGQAADGPSAIELVGKLHPDVVLMDVNLGGMSGIEATRKIIDQNPACKIIALTMHTDSDIQKAMLDAGAVAYLTKGEPLDTLVAAIRKCCPEEEDGR